MRADNDNSDFKVLDSLPLFATDAELAAAIVGGKRAKQWLREGFPTLAARPGFPKVDTFHGGRSVALVKRYYESYLGIAGVASHEKPDGDEDWSQWKKRKA